MTILVGLFHILRLANAAVTRCRQRVQQDTLEHRGWRGDPLWDIRTLLPLAPSASTTAGGNAIHTAFDAGNPHDRIRHTWVAKESFATCTFTNDPTMAAARLDDLFGWCGRERGRTRARHPRHQGP